MYSNGTICSSQGSAYDHESQDLADPGSLESSIASLAIGSQVAQTFRFFDLPYELRSKVLKNLVWIDGTIDLHQDNYRAAHRRLNIFLTSQRMHQEASHVFYSSHTFRIFPINGGFFKHKTVPLIARLVPRYQALLTSLELRLGPGWNGPPRSWRVHDGLGLENMTHVRALKVYIEVDPSQDIFSGFRVGKNYYTDFSEHLLEEIMRRLPKLHTIKFEARPSVMTNGGTIMRALVLQACGQGFTVFLPDEFELFEERKDVCSLEYMDRKLDSIVVMASCKRRI